MKKKLFFVIFTAIFSVAFFSCNDLFTNPQSGGNNLLKNPSFEMNGKPSLKYWSFRDTSNLHLVQFSNDMPTKDGTNSVILNTTQPYPLSWCSICQSIPLSNGKHVYKFSCWAKNEGISGNVYIFFKNKNIDEIKYDKQIEIKDTIWTNYSILDTINAGKTDSAIVVLSGGSSELLPGKTYFNYCDFEKVNGP